MNGLHLDARVLVAKNYRSLFCKGLQSMDATALPAPNSPSLPAPIRFHPDSNLCCLGSRIWLYEDADGTESIAGSSLIPAYLPPPKAPSWPYDAGLNILSVDDLFLYCPRSVSPALFKAASESGLHPVPVRQAYCACSVAVVAEKAAMTGDPGIARALRLNGFDVLEVVQRDIALPGYANGFIGGCGGTLVPGVWFCSGSLDSVESGPDIRRFLKKHSVQVVELTHLPLFDCGGLILLA